MVSENERLLWAGLSVVIGLVADGGMDRAFARLEAACRSFGVPEARFDGLAKRFGFWYDRSTDAYVDRSTWLMLNRHLH